MLGQFFGSRKGAQSSPPTPVLDSATEESHTRHLLYPDASTLYHPDGQPYPLPVASLTPGNAHDGPLPEIDLEFPRDCRIIIAQDEFMSMPKAVLFDSKPGPPRAESPTLPHARARVFSGSGAASTAGPTFGGMHARRLSLVTESTPHSPSMTAFARSRGRNNSISSMPNIDEHTQPSAQAQAQSQAKGTESIDVVKTCLDCMFGNTTMSYRGNSNKLHIVPLDSRGPDAGTPTPGINEPGGSLGRAEGMRRKSHLATSYTPANFPAELPRRESNESAFKEPRRRTIFITRMFSVSLSDDELDSSNVRTPTPQSSLGKGSGFPFPRTSGKTATPTPPRLPQTRKTPMYAITIILQLPVSHPASMSRGHVSKGSTSVPGHDSLGSSFDSDRRAGWTHIDPNFGIESLLSNSLNSDVDDRVDVIGQHWDVITRTLTSLQQVVQGRILAHLRRDEQNNPPVPRNQPSRYVTREVSIQPARRGARLQPNALALDPEVKDAVELAGNRVVSGMRIPRVTTGQGKWGVWREEARWLGRWAGRKEQNFFFFNLLTAFLGNHTEWLNLLGPKWHRKRHREQQRSSIGENLTISNRTVIVSPDKMAARRLIFLLAAFLPPNTPSLYDGASPLRPSTSASLRGYSQSPPTNMPPSRKQSLRRTINRRPKPKQSVANLKTQHSAPSNGSTPMAQADSAATSTDTAGPPDQSRRSSTHSVRTSLLIPSISDHAPAKSAATSTSTVTPQNAVPIPHFALPRSKPSGPSPENRPESSDSLASVNLMHNLQRTSQSHTSTMSTDSGSSSRWSVFTSFWSGGRRQSSTDQDILQTTDDGLGSSSAGSRGFERAPSQLELMVQELSMNQGLFEECEVVNPSGQDSQAAADNPPQTYTVTGSSGVPPSKARPIPERPKRFDTVPLKLSVNEKDGVIDVDIPLPDFDSPLLSPMFAPASAPSQQGSSYGEASVFSIPHGEPDQPVNAAGWLKQFHPDFAVQAIKPYADLERDIRRAMSAEPTPITASATPSLEQGPQERWIDVCSALVADTRTFSIKRIRLRRLVKLVPTPTYQHSALTPGISPLPGRPQYGNPYANPPVQPMMTEIHLEEQFTEEAIMDFDPTLIDAVERLLSQSGQPSRVHSTSSSRSSSRRGRRDTRSGSDAGHVQPEIPSTDCKAVLFDALESVVKDVTAERGGKDVAKDEPKGDNNNNNNSNTKTRQEVASSVPRAGATDSSLKEGIRRWLAEDKKDTDILHWVKPGDKTGEFKRQQSVFRSQISSKPGAEFPAEKDRYHLYVSYACPWAHRTLIVRKLKGLEEIVGVTVVHWHMGEKGWRFVTADEKLPGDDVTPDPVHPDYTHLRDIYFEQNPNYEGRFTVPTLYDKKQKRIVNNESSEIIRMFYHEFDHLLDDKHNQVDLLPANLEKEIDELNEWVYNDVNNGVYKSGFATTEEAYHKAVRQLFLSLDRLESHLSTSSTPYLLSSPHLTEADIRLYTTIVRFDTVYVQHFKCNIRDIRSGYPFLHKWLRHLYWDVAAFRETTQFEHIKKHYTKSHGQINPFAITPLGPVPDILGKEEEVRAVGFALREGA
ncbi:uncharacterized protein EI97DRAFT_460939 [Westerdykella ornata]|uniref:GST N-terminal domain-containing protein n=1 Tax=Westerdykella ornata TaxID=318751 RepID=A0A6A6JB42_WESOR|nr:uncharacterized protein EI97DRAFT_460939 [Westerdykella ornata]KAF2273505.1 hypothetical protein EI97DRAFT_460939 [Westerdykella ornata]